MVYMFLAPGFEEIEAVAPLDIMRRANIPVTTVGIGGINIKGAHDITVKADICDSELSGEPDFDMVVLPGGMPGTKNLDMSPTVDRILAIAEDKSTYIAAICAAPSILGKRRMLKSREAICYPGYESMLIGAKLSDKKVVISGNFITAAGAGVAADFGFTLVSVLKGKDVAEKLRAAMLAE